MPAAFSTISLTMDFATFTVPSATSLGCSFSASAFTCEALLILSQSEMLLREARWTLRAPRTVASSFCVWLKSIKG